MLEGNEVEQKLGENGSAIVDVSDKGVARAELKFGVAGISAVAGVEVDVIVILETLAKKTTNSVDDAMVAMIKSALGR